MRVLVTGARGQLGRELVHTVPAGVELHALGRAELDITDGDRVAAVLEARRPTVVINAAAYTAVDRAESEPEAARAANADGPGHLAEAVRRLHARLIHVSTDFVFAGDRCRPLRPRDPAEPAGMYGRTKREGERRVLESGCDAVVVRASWLYARAGRNFVNTMLRLMEEQGEVGVVADQFGAPTWARGLARILWSLAVDHREVGGLLHYSDAGCASWYDLAVAVAEEGRAVGLLSGRVRVRPITTAEYPTPAPRPRFSLLDCRETWRLLSLEPVHWRVQLRRMFAAGGAG